MLKLTMLKLTGMLNLAQRNRAQFSRSSILQAIHPFCIGLLLVITHSTVYADAKPINPDYSYFSNGDTPENWVWVLGDSENWWIPLEGNEGKSKTGKVSIKPTDYQGKGDAVTISWSKKDTWGMINIAGRNIDISKFQDKAELILIAKVGRKVKSDVKLAINCGENCKGELPIKDLLNNAKPKTWFVLPIALDCFVHAGAKLDSVNMPLSIGSGGQLDLSIAGVFIQAMQEGDEGCIPNGTPPAANTDATKE